MQIISYHHHKITLWKIAIKNDLLSSFVYSYKNTDTCKGQNRLTFAVAVKESFLHKYIL